MSSTNIDAITFADDIETGTDFDFSYNEEELHIQIIKLHKVAAAALRIFDIAEQDYKISDICWNFELLKGHLSQLNLNPAHEDSFEATYGRVLKTYEDRMSIPEGYNSPNYPPKGSLSDDQINRIKQNMHHTIQASLGFINLLEVEIERLLRDTREAIRTFRAYWEKLKPLLGRGSESMRLETEAMKDITIHWYNDTRRGIYMGNMWKGDMRKAQEGINAINEWYQKIKVLEMRWDIWERKNHRARYETFQNHIRIVMTKEEIVQARKREAQLGIDDKKRGFKYLSFEECASDTGRTAVE